MSIFITDLHSTRTISDTECKMQNCPKFWGKMALVNLKFGIFKPENMKIVIFIPKIPIFQAKDASYWRQTNFVMNRPTLRWTEPLWDGQTHFEMDRTTLRWTAHIVECLKCVKNLRLMRVVWLPPYQYELRTFWKANV